MKTHALSIGPGHMHTTRVRGVGLGIQRMDPRRSTNRWVAAPTPSGFTVWTPVVRVWWWR